MSSASAVEAAPPLAGGRYRLVSVLGIGGMATVYRGYDERLQVYRAIKILSPALANKPLVRARFEGEARTMARLDHPRIVRVFDVGVDGDRAFIIMELIDGGSLVERVATAGPLAARIALDVTADLLRALQIAHSSGVVHRDIKPHNVLLCSDGTLRVTDFGIARVVDIDQDHLTRTGAVMGTWAFMAPEQRSDAKNVDVRADIYSVGATLYSLLTNLTPVDLFAADMDPRMLAGFEPAVAGLIRASTRYRREDRFADSEQMLAAVLVVRDGLPPVGDDAIPLVPPRREAKVATGVGDFVPDLTRSGTSAPPGPSATLTPDHFEANRGATFDTGASDGMQVARTGAEPARAPPAAMTAVPQPAPLDGGDGTFLPYEAANDASVAGSSATTRAIPRWLPAALALGGGSVLLAGFMWILPMVFESPSPAQSVTSAPVVAAPAAPTATADPVPDAKAAEAPVGTEPPAPALVEQPGTRPVATPTTAASESPAPAPKKADPVVAASEPTAAATTAAADAPVAATTALDHTPVTSTSVGASLVLTASVRGSAAYDQLLVRYRPAGTARWESRSMFGSNGQYSARIAVDASMTDGIEYFIDARASDADLPALKSGSSRAPYRIAVE